MLLDKLVVVFTAPVDDCDAERLTGDIVGVGGGTVLPGGSGVMGLIFDVEETEGGGELEDRASADEELEGGDEDVASEVDADSGLTDGVCDSEGRTARRIT